MQSILQNYWCIEKHYLHRIAPLVLERLSNGGTLQDLGVINFREKKRDFDKSGIEPQSFMYFVQPDFKPASQYDTQIQDKSTAIIEVMGPILKWGEYCAYGTKDYIQSVERALNNNKIKSIVLHIDSPGGTVDGTEEMANVIKEASKKKAIVAYADGLMASAAYWIGSQCDSIICSTAKTSWVGSIGTLVRHIDQSKYLEMIGIDINYITATKSKDKVVAPESEPLSEEDRQIIVKELDEINEVFISAVKKGRKGKLKDNSMFSGKLFNGADALELGLIDSIGTLKDAITKARLLSYVS